MESISTLDWVSVSPSELSAGDLSAWAIRHNCGAVVTFYGTTRNNSASHDEIEALEYETSEELAEKSILEIITAARTRWPAIGAVAIHHRTGRVSLSEAAVVVAVSSPHRQEAFEAAQFCIDTLKESVPMWKREIWRDGSAWSTDARTILKVREP
jgi:molybdopterin synthase catalytic subunit